MVNGRAATLRIPKGYEPISTAQYVEDGVTADLIMKRGKVVRAKWRDELCRGCDGSIRPVTAWWPLNGGEPIGLYTPSHWRRVAPTAC